MNINKLNIEFNLSKKILEEHEIIINEIRNILNGNTNYKYNSKNKKIKKHFPAINTDYDEFNNTLNKHILKNNPISYSLSSKNIDEQINFILETGLRRFNLSNIYNNEDTLKQCIIANNYCKDSYNKILLPIDIRNDLQKFIGPDIKNKFPKFFDKQNNRNMFDLVYMIKTENPHYYIDGNSSTFCDTILICCNDNNNKFNIMFELDKNNHLNNHKVSETYIKKMYENNTI